MQSWKLKPAGNVVGPDTSSLGLGPRKSQALAARRSALVPVLRKSWALAVCRSALVPRKSQALAAHRSALVPVLRKSQAPAACRSALVLHR